MRRVKGVANTDRNVVVYGRLYSFGVQDLGTEVCELGGLLVRQNRYGAGVRNDTPATTAST